MCMLVGCVLGLQVDCPQACAHEHLTSQARTRAEKKEKKNLRREAFQSWHD